MSPVLRIFIRLFNAWCFAVAMFGLLLLLLYTANAVDDFFVGFRPGALMSWCLLFAPIRPLEMVLPVLGALVHWHHSSGRADTFISMLWHWLAALVGGIAMVSSSVLFWHFGALNGDPPVSIIRLLANISMTALFVIPLIFRSKLETPSSKA